jgi:predicted alpha/beta-fold hydrolase
MTAPPPAVALDLTAFRPRFPWLGGDLQTLRNFLRRPYHDLAAWPAERLELPLRDGSGDRLVASLHRAGEGARGLIVLLHGLTGCEDSLYIRASAAFWLARGRTVMRLNLRGAGPSRPLCGEHYHAGRSGDLRDALVALEDTRSIDLAPASTSSATRSAPASCCVSWPRTRRTFRSAAPSASPRRST